MLSILIFIKSIIRENLHILNIVYRIGSEE